MNLFLLRHGIPVEPYQWSGSDRTRPLTDEGRTEVRQVIQAISRELRACGLTEIWSSPYVRTAETAQIVAETLDLPCQIIPALSSGSSLMRTLPQQSSHSSRTWPGSLLCIGHQPDLGLLVSDLIGEPRGAYSLGRAGMASLQGEFRPGGMQLQWLKSAEELKHPSP